MRNILKKALRAPLSLRITATWERLGYLVALLCLGVVGYAGYKLSQNAATAMQTQSFLAGTGMLLVLFGIRIMHQRNAKYVCMALGVPMLAAAAYLLSWDSEQIKSYNQAMVAYDKHDLAAEQKLLDESSAAYKKETQRSQFAKLFLPEPRRDVEARVHNHKGIAFIQQQKAKEAVAEFFASLQVNSGNRYVGMSSEDAAQLYNDALKPKANLEILYRMGQANGQAQGKQGQQPGQGPPRPGPGKKPGPGAGKKGPGKL